MPPTNVRVEAAKAGDEAFKKTPMESIPGARADVAHLQTVEAITRAEFDTYRLTRTESHMTRTHPRFEKHVFPWIGRRPIAM